MDTLPSASADLPDGAALVVRAVGRTGAPRVPVAVQGVGGTGKTLLLAELTAAHRRAGIPVVDADSAPRSGDVERELAVLVDDAHRLTAEAAGRVRGLLGHQLVQVTVAYRPWPRSPALLGLLAEMGGGRHVVVLGHADRSLVTRWAHARLGAAATPGIVDVVLQQTAGLPALVHPLLQSLAADVSGAGHGISEPSASPGRLPRFELRPEVVDRVRAALAALDDDERALCHAVAAGAPLDAELLGDVLAVPEPRAAELVERVRATGFLLTAGTVIPLVQAVLLAATPTDITRQTRRRLVGLLLDRGEEPLALARALAADRVRDPRAARLLEEHGAAALSVDPALAGELLGEAVRAGLPAPHVAARRAQAAALLGDFDGALRWADTALRDESAPDRARAAGVTAAVVAQRGLLARSAELYRLAGPERAGSAALALLATGSRAAALATLETAESPDLRQAPSMLAAGEWLMAQGVVQSLGASPSAADDISAALSTLTRSAALLEPVGRTMLLLDTPAALAALVALHCGELAVAESVLHRALSAEVGGAPGRPRHLLLVAWVAMLRGRVASARESMARARAGRGPLEPRDELFRRALEVGLARRASDLSALVRAWGPAREAFLRHPVDLFGLLPLGELVIAGRRLQDADRLAPHLAQAQALLARLGDPQLWATPLHWSGAQAAILADDPAGLRPHASALVAAARTSPYAATLAQAGRSWLRVLTGDIDAAAVVTAAERLAAVGLAWDGSRLAGQAAARVVDAHDRALLLHCARLLSHVEDPGAPGAHAAASGQRSDLPKPPASQLSQREREVAALVVTGQTYREIGGRLFISAKTVEHHVSRMRQRLGAGDRSDLMARLRAELSART